MGVRLDVQVVQEHALQHVQVDAPVHAAPAVPVVVKEAALADAVASVIRNVLAVKVAALGDVKLIVRTTASMDVIADVIRDVPIVAE